VVNSAERGSGGAPGEAPNRLSAGATLSNVLDNVNSILAGRAVPNRPLSVPETQSAFHPLAQRNAFRRRDATFVDFMRELGSAISVERSNR
jgi:hypothetical protein